MLRNILILLPLFFTLTVFQAWGAKVVETKLGRFLENNFEGFEVPEITEIKEEGKSKRFPYVTFDEVWDSIIIASMQQGIIVRSSRDTGIMVTVTSWPLVASYSIKDPILVWKRIPLTGIISAPPLAIFVERGEVVTVYLNWMGSLFKELHEAYPVKHEKSYAEAQYAEAQKAYAQAEEKMIKDFFNKLAIQIYAGEKWNYLSKGTPK